MVHSHAYLGTRCYPKHSHTKSCYLGRVRSKLTPFLPLLKQATIVLTSVAPSPRLFVDHRLRRRCPLCSPELAAASGPYGPKTGVFALCRPPGHHAGTSLCGGYCFINNVAVAARFLQSLSPGPVERLPIAILDIDYHHGNGTQEIFYSDPSILYVSLHAEGDYPYFTGALTENGMGDGVNTNFNYPLPRGTQDSNYCTALLKAVENIRGFDPAYLLLSLGVDTFVDDPISDFKLSHSCYSFIGQAIADLGKPTLFVMEGGYHMETLGMNVRAVLQGFEERQVPDG
ncbi:hypothetical protein BJV78DRAFT_663335 [Lactifluus subvellereus]|nr:hypothetical protein BJV78DRAFT_663335 [Lactifluus subvellereus]